MKMMMMMTMMMMMMMMMMIVMMRMLMMRMMPMMMMGKMFSIMVVMIRHGHCAVVCPTMHSWLRGSMGFEKYKKWTKVDACVSFHPPNKQFCTF